MPINKNYDNLLNALLEWGKVHFLTPIFSQYPKELEDSYKATVKDVNLNDFKEFLLTSIKEEVCSAKKTLSDPVLITATEEDDIWWKAEESFLAFDKVNYLIDSASCLIAETDKNISDEILSNLDGIIADIISCLEDGSFSPLRLTILNEVRCAYLAQIPKDKRYQCPWYEIYSDYDKDIVRNIVENFDSFISEGERRSFSEGKKTRLPEIYYELKRDGELFKIIKKEAILHNTLLRIASNRSSLALWRLGDEAALDFILPEEIEKAGVVRVSRSIIEGLRPDTEAHKVYYLFLAAFCGPGLEDNQRLLLLDKIEEMIGRISINENTKEGRLLSILRGWYKGNVDDDLLIDLSFNTWFDTMKEKAIDMKEMKYDEDSESLWKALIKLSERHVLPPIIEKMIKWKQELVSNQLIPSHLSLQGVALWMRVDNRIQPEVNHNPINLTIRQNERGEYLFLPPMNTISSFNPPEAEEDYIKFRDKIGQIRGIYWGGCGIKYDDGIDVLPSGEIIGQNIFYKITGKQYQNVIIGITDDKAQLENIIKKFSDVSMKETEIDMRFDRIILLIFSLE